MKKAAKNKETGLRMDRKKTIIEMFVGSGDQELRFFCGLHRKQELYSKSDIDFTKYPLP